MMTTPGSFTTREPRTIQAMLYNVWNPNAPDVKAWVLANSGEGAELADNGMGTFATFTTTEAVEQGADPIINEIVSVQDGQYVYLDEEGLHSVEKSVFETMFEQTTI
jgi:hypothetical protein